MTYVHVPVHVPAPSPRSRELGEQISETIRAYKQTNPSLLHAEVEAAVGLAQSAIQSEFPGNKSEGSTPKVLIGALILVLLLAVAILVYLS